MCRGFGPSLLPAWVLFAAVAAIALGAPAEVAAQRADAVADVAATNGAPDDQPRRRDRRRASADERLAAEAAAAPAATATDASEAAAEAVEERMVCKNIKLSGTKIARRICGTTDQWAAMQKRTSDAAEETLRQARERQSTITRPPTEALAGGGSP